ncbi:MAG TPA: glutaminase A [Candidatus Dormibacteraeota bacterium]|nr:glutaminase A [Candidatus Dormibacteraeota bacterium]
MIREPGADGRTLVGAHLEQIHARVAEDTSGEVASYIPELSLANPGHFGIALVTADGHAYRVGDADQPFTIQSISKAMVYALALDEHGADYVTERIGVEPSGEAFNSIVMDERRNRPMNPMVNAGAIACTSLIPGRDHAEREARLLDAFRRWAGRPLEVDRAVFESERATGHRNRAIAYLELSAAMIAEPLEDHLDLYFMQCSLLVTAVDLAVMGATLACGGVNPITGERAVKAENVSRVLTVMTTCGMYDSSGDWLYRVGLPAKSGVGGGVLAVLPGQFGVATFSPRLDEYGNSCRGVEVCRVLAEEFGLHLLDAASTAKGTVLRRRYRAAQVPSRRVRPMAEVDFLAEHAEAVEILQLHGELHFATVEELVRAVEQREPDVSMVILDCRRVGQATRAALSLLSRLHDSLASAGAHLLLACCPAPIRGALTSAVPPVPEDSFFSHVDAAIEHCEDRLLFDFTERLSAETVRSLWEMDVLRDLDPDDRTLIEPYLETVHYSPGDRIMREHDRADRIHFLAAGCASAVIGLRSGGIRRLRSFGPGVMFGEAALYGGTRTADVVADGHVTCHELTTERIAEIAATRPALHAKLLIGTGRNLALLLHRAGDQLRALDV